MDINYEAKSSIQLKDSTIEPTLEVIERVLQHAFKPYLTLTARLKEIDICLEYRYYTDGNVWLGKGMHYWTGPRGGKKEINTFWLSFYMGYFNMTFYFPENQRSELLVEFPQDELMIRTAQAMGKSHQFFPLTFSINSEDHFEFIFKLINYKITHR
ncbi:MAG: DUF3788 family protein [Erysipelotrichia bacterium]|jgi:hypothetical protein|nr:DUF3788 family protein [Erysipelotrichia bacterium]